VRIDGFKGWNIDRFSPTACDFLKKFWKIKKDQKSWKSSRKARNIKKITEYWGICSFFSSTDLKLMFATPDFPIKSEIYYYNFRWIYIFLLSTKKTFRPKSTLKKNFNIICVRALSNQLPIMIIMYVTFNVV
jgi:hypothetical protein